MPPYQPESLPDLQRRPPSRNCGVDRQLVIRKIQISSTWNLAQALQGFSNSSAVEALKFQIVNLVSHNLTDQRELPSKQLP